jgi:hypothetical protein
MRGNAPPPPATVLGEPARLQRLAAIAEACGAHHLAAQARERAQRAAAGRCYVACVGQFKRGKSTLIDALAGDHLLPAGVVPVTSVPTVVRHGAERGARVSVGGGAWQPTPLAMLPEYVVEERNPGNRKNVTAVEAFTPSPLLAGGLCLVDTPGLGSVFAANAAATQAFLPQIDAALVVIGADPPLTGAELELAAEAGARVEDMIVVLNKADRVSAAEAREGAEFARGQLEARLGRPVGPIYEVSALEALSGGAGGRDWPALLEAVRTLAARCAPVAQAVAARSRGRIARQLQAVAAEELAALEQPAAAAAARAAALRQLRVEAGRWLQDMSVLGGGEQQRLSAGFAERRRNALPELRRAARAAFAAAAAGTPRDAGAAYRRALFAAAQTAAKSALTPWLETEQAAADAAYRGALARFWDLAREFAARCQAQGVELAPGLAALGEGLGAGASFQFCEFLTRAEPASPLRWMADAVLGALRAHAPIRRDAERFVDLLLETNTVRVQSGLEDRVRAGRRQLETHLRMLLQDVIAAAEGALERARLAQAAGAAAVERRRAELAALEGELAALASPGGER